jgi:hypothetical protein
MKLPLRPFSLFAVASLPLMLAACGSSNNGAPHPGPGGGGGGDSGAPDGSATGSDGGTTGQDGGGGAVCTVASAGTSGVLLQGTLLLPAGPTTGELLVSAAGTIVCAAASCSSSTGYSAATRLACPNGVISPALVNAHDHTEYATIAPNLSATTRYFCRNDWRGGLEGLPEIKDSKTTDQPTIAAQELRFVMGGATSVIGSGGVPGLLRNLAEFNNPTWLQGLTGQATYFDTFPMGDTSPSATAPASCAFPSIVTAANAFSGGTYYAPHLAEGINPYAEEELQCAGRSSNELLTAQTSIIHGVAVNANDVNLVATAKSRLIWSPRSNVSLYGNTAPVTLYDDMGVTIALGSDWLQSGSMNALREIACADSLNQKYFAKHFTDAQLFAMATSNAAAASGFGSQIGSLAAGMQADVAVFDGSVNQGYRAVLGASVEDVRLVLRGGTALYGDADLVTALNTASTCAPLTVCGSDRTVCIDTPGVTLAQVQSVASSVYPLFFCRGQTPTNEPTCAPYREDYPDGVTATDQDGDGVPDTSDDCPTIFNPARPMDAADGGTPKQSDVDGDGFGDACDAKPLDGSSH